MTQDRFAVSHLCDALIVHRNGYYQWIDSSQNTYQQQDLELTLMVQDIFLSHRRRYGARRISMELNMEEALVTAAINQAIKARQPSDGLIHHTDRGGQYAGKKYRKILSRAQMLQSMSRAGDCYGPRHFARCARTGVKLADGTNGDGSGWHFSHGSAPRKLPTANSVTQSLLS